VVDTSVLMRGFMSQRGPAGRILVAVSRRTFEPVVSTSSLVELRRVISRPSRDYYKIDRSVAELVISRLEERPLVTIETTRSPVTIRDVKDEYLVRTAIAGGVAFLVSVDNDLLVLADDLRPHGVEVVTPARFVEILGEG